MHIDVNKELDRLLESAQHDPFQVLGWQVIHREPLTVVIRTFQPRAEAVWLMLGSERLQMYRMRDAGLFEIVLPDCGVPEKYRFEVVYPDQSVRTIQDPYRFPPLLTEFDRYLFNNGTHYELYDKMGAHLLEINGTEGVIFRVWAPAAVRVSVLGNFNDWDGRVHQMRCLGTSGIWELFIPGVREGEPYKFEIKDRHGNLLEKADPFQFHAELRPKSASIVSRLDDYNWQDEEWLAARNRTGFHDRPLAIYQVHAGSWKRDPEDFGQFLSFRDLADKLIPYVKDMGFTHLELLPIMEHVRDDSLGFLVTGYFAPSSRYGSPQDLMYFIDRCHQQGLGVILDWAAGRLPPDGHGLSRFDGSSLFEEEEQVGAKLLFRYQKKEVANFLIASVLFWLDRYHVDGIRVEAATSMLYRAEAAACGGRRENPESVEFLKHLNRVVTERFPGVVMIAEEWTRFFGVTRKVDAGGLGFDFKWDSEWTAATLDYFCGAPEFRKFHHNAVIQPPPDGWAERPILPLSHKEVVPGKKSLLARMPGDRWQQFASLRLLYLLLWCRPGKNLLFMGDEFGQLSEWRSQVGLDWHLIEELGFHRQLQQFVKELNFFYSNHPALWEKDHEAGGLQWLARGDAENSIIVFSRHGRTAGDHLVCLLNFTPEVHHGYRMAVPSCIRYHEVLCSDETRFGGSNVCNPHLKEPFTEPVEEAPCHVLVSVPPLGGLILQPTDETGGSPGEQSENKQNKLARK